MPTVTDNDIARLAAEAREISEERFLALSGVEVDALAALVAGAMALADDQLKRGTNAVDIFVGLVSTSFMFGWLVRDQYGKS